MTDTSGQAAPGWYPDPSGTPRQRYFDGQAWTDHYHDDATGAPAPMGGGGYVAQGAAQPALDPIGYWKKVMMENYANFSGRARRAEYWWSALVNFGIYIVLFIIAAIIGDIGFVLIILFYLAVIIPGIAVAIRRLHDTNKSGWWLLISLVPIVGGIVLLVFTVTDGDRGPNQYGPSPKY